MQHPFKMNKVGSLKHRGTGAYSWSHRLVASFMAPIVVISGWPLAAMAATQDGQERQGDQSRKPTKVSAVDSVPDSSAVADRPANRPYTPPEQKFTIAPRPKFSASPTDGEFGGIVVLSRALYPTDNRSSIDENRELASALNAFQKVALAEDVSPLVDFLSQHPDSRWSLALQDNLGHFYYQKGYFSRALDAWEKAWKDGSKVQRGVARDLADDAVAQLAKMNARLGRVDRLESLFAEIKDRSFGGHSAELITGAKEGLSLMKTHPENSFRCGPMALGTVYNFVKTKGTNAPRVDRAVENFKSTHKGTSLAQVAAQSKKLGLKYQAAKREQGSEVLWPSVINWKVGHYAAVVGKTPHGYLIHDPTFGENLVVSRQALDEEASGYFLVASGKLPKGWNSVSVEEASRVWGKGQPDGSDPDPTTSCDQKSGGDQGGGCCGGMPGYSVHTMLVSLNIVDTPLWYHSAYGKPLNFTLTYNQRDPESPDDGIRYGGFGDRWTTNGISFVRHDPSYVMNDDVKLYVQGGGFLNFHFSPKEVPSSGGPVMVPGTVSDHNQKGQAILTRGSGTGPTAYTLQNPDGSKAYYGYADGSIATSATGRVYMTGYTDAQGNTTTYSYTTVIDNITPTHPSVVQLISATDATGQQANYTYSPTNPYLITQILLVGDGRHADFGYDAAGRLTSITDMGGLTSSFTYIGDAPATFINSMTTPYGTTHFSYGDGSTVYNNVARWFEATDPLGATERTEFSDASQFIGDSEPADTVPPSEEMNTINSYLKYRNSFFWSKKAYAIAKGDRTKARIYHWLHTEGSLTSGILESKKEPLENRVWYNYPGQDSDAYYEGTSDKPSIIGRMVVAADGSLTPQIYRYTYDDFGNVTEATDPKSRVTKYTYNSDPDSPVLINVQQMLDGGDSDTLATYNYNHPGGVNATNKELPYRVTNAAGQTKTYTYTTKGQLGSVSVLRNIGTGATVNNVTETTTYSYGTTAGQSSYNRLTDVYGPGNVLLQHITYDSRGRQYETTDVTGYKLTYGYDDLDHVTSITYPDATTEKMIYAALDVSWKKDRLGRWTHYYHDPLRRLTQVDDPAGHSVKYNYCPCGALEGIVDGEGHTTTFIYDAQTRLTNKIYADTTKQTVYEYEKNPDGTGASSRLRKVTDAKHQDTNYTYNEDNTISSISYTNTVVATPSVTYEYEDFYNRLWRMHDGTGFTTYSYYPSGSLGGGCLQDVDGPLDDDTVSYSYDELGRVLSSAVNNVPDTVAYDSLGRVTGEINALSTTPFGFFYVGNTNMVDHIAYPNGQLTSYKYYGTNRDNRLQTIWNNSAGSTINATTGLVSSTGTLSKFDYDYNATGNVTLWTQQIGNGSSVDHLYGYDGTDQLLDDTQKNHGTGSVQQQSSWDYDKAGNRLKEQLGVTVTGASFNELNQLTGKGGGGLLTVAGTVNEAATVTVGGKPAMVDENNKFRATVQASPGATSIPITATDKSGNNNQSTYHAQVTVAPGISSQVSFLYDENGNMKKDNMGRTFEWDAANRLLAINNGTRRSEFTYNGMGQRVSEIEMTNGILNKSIRFIWDSVVMKEERDGVDNTVTKRFCGTGEQINGENYFFTSDHLGSLREVTDAAGTLQSQYAYDDWGLQTRLYGSFDAYLGYTGHFKHIESGLYLTFYRQYDAGNGIWLTRDPLAEKAGSNLYRYVENSPLDTVDPLGLLSKSCKCKAVRNEERRSALTIASLISLKIRAAKAFDDSGDESTILIPPVDYIGILFGKIPANASQEDQNDPSCCPEDMAAYRSTLRQRFESSTGGLASALGEGGMRIVTPRENNLALPGQALNYANAMIKRMRAFDDSLLKEDNKQCY